MLNYYRMRKQEPGIFAGLKPSNVAHVYRSEVSVPHTHRDREGRMVYFVFPGECFFSGGCQVFPGGCFFSGGCFSRSELSVRHTHRDREGRMVYFVFPGGCGFPGGCVFTRWVSSFSKWVFFPGGYVFPGGCVFPPGKTHPPGKTPTWKNLFTAMLASVSLGKRPTKVPNLKSLRLFPPFARAGER